MAIYKVPTLFLRDHLNRCDECLNDDPIIVLKSGKLLSNIDVNAEKYQDLKSDAEVYADLKNGDEYEEMPSLINSAINTLKRLER